MKKLIYKYIKEDIESKGYKVLTNRYINSKKKLKCICTRNHEWTVSWSDWKRGRRCSKCFHMSRANKLRMDFNMIKESFKKEKYILHTVDYTNCDQKLEYTCNRGHKHSISWHNWQRGHRCLYCYYEDEFKRKKGKDHWNWKGGVSKEPYCQDWTKDLKEFVKERDDHKCLNPNCNAKNSEDLTVHHIDYNKKSCGPENLITICRSCNSIANKNRKWHEAWYKAILYRRYKQ